MRQRMTLVASALSALLVVPLASVAQTPYGVERPKTPSLPSAPAAPTVPSVPGASTVPSVPSKDALLKQANGVVSDLTALKASGKLAGDQAKRVDTLLPKATSMAGELAKPQVDATRLPKLASELNSLQQQVTTLKGLVGR